MRCTRSVLNKTYLYQACLFVQDFQTILFHKEWEMFAGLKIGRNSSSPIELPNWIDESRANNIKTLKVFVFYILRQRLDNFALTFI